MVQITTRDIGILLSMVIAITMLTWVSPALAPGTSIDHPPQFDINANRFDFAGEFPDDPRGPTLVEDASVEFTGDTQGTVWVGSTRSQALTENITLRNGLYITYERNDNQPNETFMQIYHYTDNLQEEDDPSQDASVIYNYETTTFSQEGQTYTYENTSTNTKFSFAVTDLDRANSSDPTSNVTYSRLAIQGQAGSSDGGFWSNIPVLGSVIDAGEAVAGAVVWVGSILYWLVATFITIFANTFSVIFDVISYAIGLVGWITSSFGAIITNTPSWAGIIFAIPYVLVGYVLSKFVLMIVEILWIG